jgi:phosphopantothenoylcysteine decarboxylase/phosphopantothenate--cysteine ligase
MIRSKAAPLTFVVTAGPTREYLDPVRFLSNPSTGKMGFAVARAAAARGHAVTLVAGPVARRTPSGVDRIDVTSAREMDAAVRAAVRAASGPVVFVATAAVADWRPAVCAARKLKKNAMSGVLNLVRNPDILAGVTGARKIGFAAETDNVLAEAVRKCRDKGLEMIVANDVTAAGAGFGCDTNRVTFVTKDGIVEQLPLKSKLSIARRIVRFAERLPPA